MLLSYLKADRFVLLAQNSRFQLKRELPLEQEKTGKYEKMIADHGSPSWKLKCIVAEVGCPVYIYPTFFQKSTSTLWIHFKGIESPC